MTMIADPTTEAFMIGEDGELLGRRGSLMIEISNEPTSDTSPESVMTVRQRSSS